MEKVLVSKIQLGIYNEEIQNKKSTKFNLPFLVKLNKDIDVDKFISALKTVIGKRKILSSKLLFDEKGNNLYLTYDGKNVEPKIIRTNKVDEEKLVRKFDLLGGDLSRFVIFETANGKYYFQDIHYIICDGTTVNEIFNDIEKAYNGKSIDDEKCDFFKYLSSKKEVDKKKYDEQIKYYDEMLSDIETDNLILRDKYEDEPNSGIVVKNFDIELEDFLNKNKDTKITKPSFFLNAFAFLLCKYNGTKSTITNMVHHGRDEEVRNTYGMFVETKPFIFEYNNDESIIDILHKNTDVIREIQDKDEVLLSDLVDKYGIGNDILFTYQDAVTNFELMNDKELTIKRIYDSNHIEEEKIFFEILKNNEKNYQVHLLYRSDYYSKDMMESFVDAYIKIVKEFVVKKCFKDVEITDEEELAKLDGFFGTTLKYDENETIVSLINRSIVNGKNNLAVVAKNGNLTYEELRAESNKFSNFLIESGVKKGDVVAILIDRDVMTAVLPFAVSKIGATYMPIDPAYPDERINFMLKDSETKILFALSKYKTKITDEYKGQLVCIDDESFRSKITNANDVNVKVDANDRFIILYTSGTTGTPKGVELLHKNIVATITYINNMRRTKEKFFGNVRVAAYASFGFDANMYDMYPPLTSGGTLYIIPDEIRLDLYAIREFYNKNKITHGFMTTQVARQFVEFDGLDTLVEFATGGEKLASVKPPRFKFFNLYGPTECSMFSTSFEVNKVMKDIPIGHAIDNNHLYVIDELNHRLPVGASGELLITGPQVAKGYLNRPDKTNEVFVSNPFSTKKPFDRAYKTGDVVRFLPDGNIQYVGRRDMQVKVRGFRIELSEVEEVIRRYKDVKDVTVVAYDDEAGMKYLVAYVVSDVKIDPKRVNEFILKEKPAYMVPSIIMQIDSIPLTHNQKVNKRALPKPEMSVSKDIKLPKNKVQEKIHDAIASVLGNKNFGIDDDIFALGINSISMVRLNVLLGKLFDIPLRLADIKNNSAIEKLEQFINKLKNNNSNESLGSNVVLDKYPISKTQEGIFVESIANPDTTIYNMPVLLKIDNGIDVFKLKNAIIDAINAHPYAKASIGMDNNTNEIYAKRNDDAPVNVDIKDIDKMPDKYTLSKPFALMNKSLYRFIIFNTKQDGKYLFMDMHHIIGDGISLVILLNDIEKAYKGIKLEKEKFTGFNYALEEQKLLKTDTYESAKKYYETLLEGADTESLIPKDNTGIEEKLASNLVQKVNLNKSEIEKFCNEQGITLNSFFNAVFGFTLSKYNYKENVVYTTIYNGRNDSRVDEAVYMLVKTLSVVCKYDKDTKIKDYLTEYNKQIFDSMTNDLYSFQEISRNQHVSADVLFIYQGDNFEFANFCGRRSELIDIESSAAMEPFKIDMDVINNEFVAKAEFRKDYFANETIAGFIECMEAVAKEFMTKEKLCGVSLFTDRTKKLVDRYNDTDIPVEHISEVKAFENAVEKYKDRVAVIAKDESITFDELNKRSNRLAHSLIDLGVKLDEFVGLMMDRCANAYVGRQGILKAGGAFLAIDPKYPDDRISYILSDSKAKLLVTKKEIADKKKELLDNCGVKVYYIEELLNNNNDSNPNVEISPNNLAYCLYTSGSTGKPKGVMVEHRGVVNLATDSDKSVQVRVFTIDCKVILALAALTFDVSVGEHMIGLLNGLTVAIASEDEIMNPLLLCDMIIKNKVDGFTCTPSYINNMLDIKETYPALRQIKGFQIGAETFPKQLFRKMRDNGINGRITNSYGPTEATDYSTTNFIEDENFITIGKPLPNYKIYVFDKYGNSVPPRIMGEVVICGIGVARGYVGREDLNKERFFKYNNLLAYKSGDLGKWNYRGTIDFIGRMDNQVKFHGLRIELDEISNVINSYQNIKQSITVVKQDESGDEYLASYFIASEKINIDDLNAHIKKYLTEYMVPTSIMQLDSFPMNVNGKVDKTKLPEPGKEEVKKEVKAANGKLEEQILEMFKSALNKDNIGVDDDFFKCGGTSLTVSKIAMKAMTSKLPITYSDVFDYPTVESLTKLVNERLNDTAGGKKDTKKEDFLVKNNSSVDKAEVKKALANNIVENVDDVKISQFGDVVLTGATGFLGIHVLKYLIDNTDKKIYCFLRKGKMSSLIAKMKNYLMYYFDDPFDNLFGKRIFLVSGDITDKESVEHLSNYEFDAIFNCAACVKHFGNDDTLYKVNVKGVENLVDYCVKNNKRLIHVSTASVAGATYEGSDIADKKITENILNLGQDISNKYVNTKYNAEEIILTNITNNNLKAKIVRVGNLMSRYSDGEFQINSIENAFMKQLKAYYSMKAFPISQMDEICEFSPVDLVAESIVRLANTNDEFTTFLSCNEHFVQMGDVIYAMNKIGAGIRVVSDDEFNDILNSFMKDETKNNLVSILISYNLDSNKKIVFIGYDCKFTTKILYRINFRWPIVTEDYIEKSLLALMRLGYFDGEMDK